MTCGGAHIPAWRSGDHVDSAVADAGDQADDVMADVGQNGISGEAVELALAVDDQHKSVGVQLQVSPSKVTPAGGAPHKQQNGKASSNSHHQQRHKGDLSFLDPVNMADCPPVAIRLAAGELVLRIREERRRRAASGLDQQPQLPQQRMVGDKPGEQ